jgi:hypothetical protein
MIKKLIYILLLLPLNLFAQGNFFWSHIANVPIYDGNIHSYTFSNCASISSGYDLLNNRVFENYDGETKDSIKIISFNNNYDEDSYSSFELLDSLDGNEISLPFQISIYGLSDEDTYPNIVIQYNNYVGGVYILCNNAPQQCSFQFKIQDINGIWGSVKTFILTIDYNP